jgi:hypothetical protein
MAEKRWKVSLMMRIETLFVVQRVARLVGEQSGAWAACTDRNHIGTGCAYAYACGSRTTVLYTTGEERK